MSEPRRLGEEAESSAAEYLLEQGYTIITRRYRVKGGEVDIIALDGETLVFVEVKGRLAPGHIPEEAVGERKFSRMAKAAARFRNDMPDKREFRYDLIAIDARGLRHYKSCFGNRIGDFVPALPDGENEGYL